MTSPRMSVMRPRRPSTLMIFVMKNTESLPKRRFTPPDLSEPPKNRSLVETAKAG